MKNAPKMKMVEDGYRVYHGDGQITHCTTQNEAKQVLAKAKAEAAKAK